MATTSEYTPVASRNRLRFVQHLCRVSGDSTDTAPDAILCLPGADGRYAPGATSLLKYLLLGSSGASLVGAHGGVDPAHEALEDCVLVVSCDRVAVFHPPAAAPLLAPHLAVWRNVTVHTITPEESENVEASELFKIKAFVRMVAPYARVGVPLTPGWRRGRAPDAALAATTQFEVEEWPLVQAFGLADMGTGGFFTMVHSVVDVGPQLRAVYAAIDAHAVKLLAYETSPDLEKHWESFSSVLSVIKTPSRRLALSEEVVGNAILTYYNFGRIHEAEGAAPPEGHGARVLFGTRSSVEGAVSGGATVEDSGVAGMPARHLTAEAEDPDTCVRVARSYFLASGDVALVPGLPPVDHDHVYDPKPKAPAGGAVEGDAEGAAGAAAGGEAGAAAEAAAELPTVGEDIDAAPGSRDARYLRALYVKVLAALHGAIRELGPRERADCPSRCLMAAFDAFAPPEEADDAHDAAALPEDFDLGENLDVYIDGFDATGKEQWVAGAGQGASAFGGTRLAVYVRVALRNVPSLEHAGAVLGSLVAGDTVLVGLGEEAEETAPFVLTDKIPYYRSFVCGGVEEASVLALQRGISSPAVRASVLGLGALRSGAISGARLLTGGALQPFVVGVLRVFETGLVVTPAGGSPLPLSALRHMEAVDVVPAARAVAATGWRVPGGVERERERSAWAEEGCGPGERRGQDDPFPACDDVLVIKLRRGGAGVPSLSTDPALQAQCGWLALLLPAASQLHSVQQAVLAALPDWQREVAFARAMREHDDPVAVAADPDRAPAVLLSPDEGDTRILDLPPELHAAYRLAVLPEWQAQWRCRGTIERCLLSDATRRIRGVALAAPSPLSDAIPVTIVVGAPGGGKSRFAAQMAATSSDEHAWRVVHQPLARGIAFRPGDLQSDLLRAARSFAGSPKTPRIAVVAPGFADVAAVARAVALAGPVVYVSGCVACLHAKSLWGDSRRTRWLPRLLEQMSEGWVHHVALCGCEDVDDAEVAALKAVVRLANPQASIMNLTGGLGRPLNLDPSLIPAVLDDAYFAAARSAVQRQLACPGWDAPEAALPPSLRAARPSLADAVAASTAAEQEHQRWREAEARIEGVCALSTEVQHVVVEKTVAFDARRLEAVLRRIVRPAHDPVAAILSLPVGVDVPLSDIPDPLSPLPAVWRAKGFVRLTDDPTELWQVDAVPGIVRFSKAEARQVPALGGPTGSSAVSTLLLVGPQLEGCDVEGLVERCRPRLPQPRPTRDASSITDAERAAIRKAHLSDPLPDGVWFDGSRYIDFTGKPLREHPDMEAFVAAWLAEVNAGAAAYNAEVQAIRAAAEREAQGGGLGSTPWWSTRPRLPGSADEKEEAKAPAADGDSDLDELLHLREPPSARGAAASAAPKRRTTKEESAAAAERRRKTGRIAASRWRPARAAEPPSRARRGLDAGGASESKGTEG